MLKWQLEPEKRSRSWSDTIIPQRIEIEDALKQSPSLRGKLQTELPGNYASAVRRAVGQTDLAPSRFPNQCPFTVEQILDPEFLP